MRMLWTKVEGTQYDFIAENGVLKQRPYCKETSVGVYVHYYPGIASAAIQSVVDKK